MRREAETVSAIEQKIKGVIARYAMLPPGCAVVAGFSGGADSAALTHFLFTHREEYAIQLTAAHVNHGLREAAGADEEAARSFCAERGIPFRCLRADVAALAGERGLCIEACGRQVRYDFFHSLLGEDGGRIATAHTASDNAETMLMNLARGAGTHGLGGIPPVRGAIVRPLAALTRQEVEVYCAHYGLSWVQDETNFANAYARNRVRLAAVPALRTLNPALEGAMLRTAELLREDDELLEAMARSALEEAKRGGGWDLAALRRLPRPVLSRALIAAVQEAGPARLTRENVEEMMRAVLCGGGVTVAGGIQILAKGNTLFAQQPGGENEGFCVPLSGGEARLPDGRVLRIRPLTREEAENPQKFYKFLFHNPGNYDTIQNDMVVRTRLPGDRFRPAGRGVSKPLRRLLAEAGVPPASRGRVLLLALRDSGEILWAQGLGPCEAWSAGGRTDGVLRVEIENEGE